MVTESREPPRTHTDEASLHGPQLQGSGVGNRNRVLQPLAASIACHPTTRENSWAEDGPWALCPACAQLPAARGPSAQPGPADAPSAPTRDRLPLGPRKPRFPSLSETSASWTQATQVLVTDSFPKLLPPTVPETVSLTGTQPLANEGSLLDQVPRGEYHDVVGAAAQSLHRAPEQQLLDNAGVSGTPSLSPEHAQGARLADL